MRRANGLDFNGTLFFAAENEPQVDKPSSFIEGFVEANLLIREAAEQFLTFGKSGMEMYSLNLEIGEYQIVDRVSLDTIESFDSFESLFAEALTMRL